MLGAFSYTASLNPAKTPGMLGPRLCHLLVTDLWCSEATRPVDGRAAPPTSSLPAFHTPSSRRNPDRPRLRSLGRRCRRGPDTGLALHVAQTSHTGSGRISACHSPGADGVSETGNGSLAFLGFRAGAGKGQWPGNQQTSQGRPARASGGTSHPSAHDRHHSSSPDGASHSFHAVPRS